ncbi:fimbrial protein [Vagococcus sp. WN89Y]|uniref:fimbrial protein n=1 Tax=Vagococcus sp. WN89Y TaxID=3457258 RepID=UPI003FCDC9F0
MDKTISLLVISISLFISCKSFAACTSFMATKTINFSLPSSLVVPDSTPVGSPFYTMAVTVATDSPRIAECTGSEYYRIYTGYDYSVFSGNPINNYIIDTNIPGVGLKTITHAPNVVTIPLNNVPTPGYSAQASGYGVWMQGTTTVTVQLIKTNSSPRSGDLLTGAYMTIGAEQFSVKHSAFSVSNTVPTRITGSTHSCDIVGNADKVISFGTVVNKNLSSLTGTIPDTDRYINIELKCTPGTKVGITYDSTDKHSYLQSCVINRGTAKDVLVLFQDGIGKLGQQNTVIQSSGETEVIKQRVSLYASGSPTPGSISAQATYTLNYE